MTEWSSVNKRKIVKVVYLLLEKYHRAYGLAAIGWSKPPGNLYFSFYCLAARTADGQPLHLPDLSGRLSLTIYQDHVGLPAWGAGQQWQHPDANNRELRTVDLMEWYEERLDLERLFSDYSQQICAWRQAYHVSQSEPYLLTWNVMGLFASLIDNPIETYGNGDGYLGNPGRESIAVAQLGCDVQLWESIHRCCGVYFSNIGKARLPNGQDLDIWEKRLRGQSVKAIAAEIAERISQT